MIIIYYMSVTYFLNTIFCYLMARDIRKLNPTKEIKIYDKEIIVLTLFWTLSPILLPIVLIVLTYREIKTKL